MTKRSRFEQQRRAHEQERIQEIEAGWQARLSAADKDAFRREVELAQGRRPEPHTDMPPGTAPNPPRPGREPRPAPDQRTRRSWI